MSTVGAQVRALIEGQARVWPSALAEAWPLGAEAPLVFVGSGSSYYLAQVAAAVARRLHVPAWAAPAGEVWLEPQSSLLNAKSVLIVSRSGTTSEALLAAKAARDQGLVTYGLTCNPDTPLAAAVDKVTVLPADDATVVMIQSYTAMLLWLEASLALGAGTSVASYFQADRSSSLLQQARTMTDAVLQDPPRRTIYLGAGVRYGIAREAALKALEMGGGQVLWYHPLEFRHGPWGSVEAGDVVWLLGQEALVHVEASLVEELQARGASVIELARNPTGRSTRAVRIPDGVPDLFSGPLAVIPLQWYAWAWAVRLGQDPDRPRNLTKVVRLD
ncbi:MAG: SIS domain-containing protein [Clostridia bacterium]